MKITGERVSSPEGGFNPTWQRHVAALRPRRALARRRAGPGPGLRGRPQLPPARSARDRRRRRRRRGARGAGPATVVADMRSLPSTTTASRRSLSVQSLEHVPDPERVVAEVARVLAPDGVAVFVTPNRLTLGRPDEIIDPYHYIEFDVRGAATLCGRFFGRVDMRGLFGSAALHGAVRRGARASSTGCCDSIPRACAAWCRCAPSSASTTRCSTATASDDDPRAEAIDPDDFEFRDSGLETRSTCARSVTRPRRSDGDRRGTAGRPRHELRVVRRRLRRPRARGCRAGSAARVRRGDDRPMAVGRGARRRLRRPGTGRTPAAGSASSATRC